MPLMPACMWTKMQNGGKKKKDTHSHSSHTHTHTSMHKVLIQHMNYENASICNILPSVFLPAVRVTPHFSSPTTQCGHVGTGVCL